MRTGMQGFLECVGGMPNAPIHRVSLLQWFGPEILAAAVAEGLFVPGGELDWYPCPGSDADCPRRVSRNALPKGDKPHFAGCATGSGCENLWLSTKELETLQFMPAKWWSMLQRMLNVEGEPVTIDTTADRAWKLGRRTERGLGRTVLALMGYHTLTLGLELGAIEARHAPAMVLLPLSAHVPGVLIQSHRAGAAVELAFIEDRLSLDNGHFGWRDPKQVAALLPPVEDAPARFSKDAFCIAFDGNRRELTRQQYDEAVDRADQVDLFLDITEARGNHALAGRRLDDGTFEAVSTLNTAQGEVLAKLMLSGKPTRPARLRPLARGDHDRYVDDARVRIDKKRGRGKWEWFKSVGPKGEREIHFCPDSKTRYLLLCRPEFVEARAT